MTHMSSSRGFHHEDPRDSRRNLLGTYYASRPPKTKVYDSPPEQLPESSFPNVCSREFSVDPSNARTWNDENGTVRVVSLVDGSASTPEESYLEVPEEVLVDSLVGVDRSFD